ncbi:hypothetical protein [Roseomonas sp. WA12]
MRRLRNRVPTGPALASEMVLGAIAVSATIIVLLAAAKPFKDCVRAAAGQKGRQAIPNLRGEPETLALFPHEALPSGRHVAKQQ